MVADLGYCRCPKIADDRHGAYSTKCNRFVFPIGDETRFENVEAQAHLLIFLEQRI
jgi:hypothetical protein